MPGAICDCRCANNLESYFAPVSSMNFDDTVELHADFEIDFVGCANFYL